MVLEYRCTCSQRIPVTFLELAYLFGSDHGAEKREMRSSLERLQVEETRIREAYAKRKELASLYSCFNPGNLFITHTRERRLLQLLKQYGFASLATKKILEIGCGKGYWLREFVRFGARPENIAGIDLIPEDVKEAIRLSPPGMQIERGNAAELGFADESFDIVFQFTVFTSILDPDLKRKVAAEMVRVLKKDGLIVWYDFHMKQPLEPRRSRRKKTGDSSSFFRVVQLVFNDSRWHRPLPVSSLHTHG